MKQAKHVKILFLAAALCSLSCFVYVNVDAASQPKHTFNTREIEPLRNMDAEEEGKETKVQFPVVTLVGKIIKVAGDLFTLLH